VQPQQGHELGHPRPRQPEPACEVRPVPGRPGVQEPLEALRQGKVARHLRQSQLPVRRRSRRSGSRTMTLASPFSHAVTLGSHCTGE
jgi:hypothetical protein